MKNMKKLLLISLIINLFFIIGISYFIYSRGGIIYVLGKLNIISTHAQVQKDPYYEKRKGLFDLLSINKNDIIFLGDSITTDAEWDELLQNQNIKNRGIPGDKSNGVLNRLESIISGKPEKVFIMVGINDIYSSLELSDIENNFENILKTITRGSPKTEIYIQSVLPVNNELTTIDVSNKDICELNIKIGRLAKQYNATYIDLYNVLSDSNGDLKKEYTVDGIHLTGKAYIVLKEILKEYVN